MEIVTKLLSLFWEGKNLYCGVNIWWYKNIIMIFGVGLKF